MNTHLFASCSTLDDEVTSLDEFSPTLLVQVVSKCITLIDSSLDLPRTLPPGMAQRFTATASLAEACRVREINFSFLKDTKKL